MSNTKLHKSLLTMLIGATLLATAGGAFATDGSQEPGPSGKVVLGTLSIVAAPAISVAGSNDGGPVVGVSAVGVGSAYVIIGIAEGASDTVQVVLQGVGNSAKASVNLSKSAAQTLGLSVGTSVQLSAEASGTVLIASGKVIAFIPNELGKALLGQSRIPNS
jgi:hypothetical protein